MVELTVPGPVQSVTVMITRSMSGNLADRLMFRLAYRNFGTPTAPDESLVANYTVSSGGATA